MSSQNEDAKSLTLATPLPIKLLPQEVSVYRQVLQSVPEGHFLEADAFAVAHYARLVVQHEKATAACQNQPFTSRNSQGEQVNPALRAADMLSRRLLAMQAALKLTPASRTKTTPTKLGQHRRTQADAARQQAAGEPPARARRPELLFGGLRAAADDADDEDKSLQ